MDQNRSQQAFASPVVASFWRAIDQTMGRLIGALDGLSEDQLNWRPDAPNTNTLYVLATHTLGNVAESVLEILGGQPVNRNRDAEFEASGASANALKERWHTLRGQSESVLQPLTEADLEHVYTHPRRNQITGYDLLILVSYHAAEHAGQAELTRDLLQAEQ